MLAQEMKGIVREQLAAGRSPEEVKAYFVEKYGEWILLRPRARGWNMLVYVLPLVALAIGLAVIARATRRWSAHTDPHTAPPEP
jgi:cytochrome c-type biogenesis protein CcmH